MVRGDEAGHDDRARAIDDLGVAGGDVGRDLGDQLSVDQDVGLLEVAHLRVEAEHDASPQQDAAPAAVADEALRVLDRRGPEAGELSGYGGGGKSCRAGREKVASRVMGRHRWPF